MFGAIKSHVVSELEQIKEAGLYKSERIIVGQQDASISVQAPSGGGRRVLNLCANNYLGLANHPQVIKAAKDSYDKWGYGLSSVRFICGTQDIHKQLEKRISEFLGTEDTILYSCCFDANTGLFETLLTAEDAIISDSLNHASVIDGIRLCKAQRLRFENCNMVDLEEKLKQAQSARFRLIATDGVFSMDGTIAKLREICDLADKYDALVMIDDSHGVGVLGRYGRGTHEHCQVMGRVDIITGTLGKALGGASGGYTSGRKEIIEILRQRSETVSILQHAGAEYCRRFAEGAGVTIRINGAAGQTSRKHPLFSREDDLCRVQYYSRRASYCADYVGRRGPCSSNGRNVAGRRRLRDRVFVSGRAARCSSNPHSNLRGPY